MLFGVRDTGFFAVVCPPMLGPSPKKRPLVAAFSLVGVSRTFNDSCRVAPGNRRENCTFVYHSFPRMETIFNFFPAFFSLTFRSSLSDCLLFSPRFFFFLRSSFLTFFLPYLFPRDAPIQSVRVWCVETPSDIPLPFDINEVVISRNVPHFLLF